MKIVCDSCSAKYSIADEKVAGKVFKIRCKKCSEVIVVRGDQLQPEQEEATQIYDYGAENPDAVWHVVVNGEQQGPLAPGQVSDMLSAGTIDWEAYVWREGFDNWQPARDVTELVQAISGPAAGAAAAAPAAEEAPAASGGLFAAASAGGGGADLFGQGGGGSPFEAPEAQAAASAPADSQGDVVASAPSPRVSADEAMTGKRNENSVLFSLANLQALATGPGGNTSPTSGPAMSAPKAGHAMGEGSGLIDIRALASTSGVVGGGGGLGASPGIPKQSERVDDLLGIGTGAPIGGGLAAPVLAPVQEEKSNKGTIIAIAAAAGVAVLAAAAVVIVVLTKEPEQVASAGQPGAATTGAGAIAPGVAPAAPAAAEPTPAAPTEPAAPAAEEPAAAEAEAEEEASESRRARSGGSRSGSSTSSMSSGSAPAASGGAAAPAPTTMAGGGGGGNIDDLLNRALSGSGGGGGGAMRAAAPAASNLPETPSRQEVVSALQAVQGAVSACGGGQHGVASTAITVSGSNGRVTGANVTGQFAGTPVGSCIARAVRGARFPRFSRPTFQVTFPFRI